MGKVMGLTHIRENIDEYLQGTLDAASLAKFGSRAPLTGDAVTKKLVGLDAATAVQHQDARCGRDMPGNGGDLARAEEDAGRIVVFEIIHGGDYTSRATSLPATGYT